MFSLRYLRRGVYSTWYTNAEDMLLTFLVNELRIDILLLKEKALSSD